MNGAPKHVENVACGSLTPRSVPATFAVYPERKWYIACSRERREIGGSTPNASAVSMTMFLGCPALLDGTMFGMNVSGYAERVFSVFASESTSISRVRSSYSTFSTIVEKRFVAAQISGSAVGDNRITLA